ncbi:MAG: hypothetical protein IPK63_23665 [Candidatus Competibacteraceae bacterium]|nr:hypothetical protein [Candidatus Competibacteraceae bacterium]
MESQPQPLNNGKAKNMDVLSRNKKQDATEAGKVRPREAVEAGILESEARHFAPHSRNRLTTDRPRTALDNYNAETAD